MRSLVWIGLAIWLCMPAVAETLVVRSGEHQGFTRLVLKIPPGTHWTLENDDREVSLNIDILGTTIDTSQVFSRIGRSRLSTVTQSEPGAPLELLLGCECDVVGFVQSDSLLVIDVKDPSNLPPQKPRFGVVHAQEPYRFQLAMEVRPSLPVVLTPNSMQIERSQSAGSLGNTGGVHHANTDLNISEKRLLEQISRATSQGLLVQNGQFMIPAQDHVGDAPGDLGTDKLGNLGLSNLIATTVVDRDMEVISSVLDPSVNGRECIETEYVAVSAWGDERSFGAQVSFWRSNLFGEFDTVNPESVMGLARTYLYFGFGEEAIRVLELGNFIDIKPNVIRMMADIIDHGKPTGQNPFAHQQGCDGDIALWSLLSEESVSASADMTAMQRAFVGFPSHLKVYLGPRISQIFTKAGEHEAAEVILRAVSRTGTGVDSAYKLAEAATTRSRGQTEDATDQLLKVVNQGSEQSPQAVIDLIDEVLSERKGISPDLPDLIAAYASEYRKSELGPDLRRTHIGALALSGRHSEASVALKNMKNVDDIEVYTASLNSALALLIENADDVTFLEIGLEQISNDLEAVPSHLSGQMARRMLDLGFSSEAIQLLGALKGGETSDTHRLMRAEGAIAQGLPHRAMVELLSLIGEDAEKLRAEALWQIEDYQKAATHLLAVQEINAATRGLWFARQWDVLPEADDTHYGKIASVARQLDVSAPDLEPLSPLAEARALIETSRIVRNDVSDLRNFVGSVPLSD